jgi:hypothetical protein
MTKNGKASQRTKTFLFEKPAQKYLKENEPIFILYA